jgi:hypothetical protein
MLIVKVAEDDLQVSWDRNWREVKAGSSSMWVDVVVALVG